MFKKAPVRHRTYLRGIRLKVGRGIKNMSKQTKEIDLLIAEIGSTTTLVNGFDGVCSEQPRFIGQGLAPTSVLEGDVMIGLKAAIKDLQQELGTGRLVWKEFMATSSAAGGLKMTVHGLVKDMTVRAAREAALGAGGVIKMVTAGRLKDYQLDEILEISPNIILLAGGVDYGEEEVIIHNAERLKNLGLDIPIIYAGNKVLQKEVARIFKNSKKELLITENVYPEIDTLNIQPTRKLIHEVFARHITKAPGMEKIKERLSIDMLPTPGAVMEAALILKELIGNLVVIDVGGATTDVHSVTTDSPVVKEVMINPEPEAKRTVEGDLGVYLNAANVYQLLGETDVEEREVSPLPGSKEEESYIELLTQKAVLTAVARHAGKYKDYYSPLGRQTVAEGKDLTAVRWIIGTGGSLSRLVRGKEILEGIKGIGRKSLFPGEEAEVLIDNNYIMASLGMMSKKYPEAALVLLKESIGL